MAEVTINVPLELKREIQKFDKFTLSLALQKAVDELEEWTEVRKLVSKSRLTEKQALAISRKINKGMAKRYTRLMKTG